MSSFKKHSLSDEELVRGIQAGKKEREKAIEALYDQNRAFLMKFLANRSNAQDYVKQPDDILWEAVEVLVGNILDGKYVAQPGTSLSAYLTSICRNLWHKFLSQETHRQEREMNWLDDTDAHASDVSELIAGQESWLSYLTIFEQVGRHCRQLLTLWLVDGLSGRETAEVLISEGKFKSEQSVRNAKSDCMEKVAHQLQIRQGKTNEPL